MKRMLSIAALLLIVWLPAAREADALEVVAPASTVLGDALSVYLPESRDILKATIRLADLDGKVVAAARAFPLSRDGNVVAWVALMGVPTTIDAGSYHIESTITTQNGVVRQSSPVTVASREFVHENIDLNQDLSTLQTEETALKKKQAEQLWRILTTFNDKAVYQLGPLIMPVDNYIVTSPFAERRVYVLAGGGDQHSIHEGLDLAVPAGTPIKACGAGRVVFAGPFIMTGNTVVIEQLPGVYSLYYHMERSVVSTGQVVEQGETIGYVGSTGLATGPHLHWQIEIQGIPVDPMSLLRAGLVNDSKLVAVPVSH